MTGLAFTLFWLGVLFAVAYLPVAVGEPGWRRSTLKTLPLATFAITAVVAGAPGLLLLALVASAIGDFALSRRGTPAFAAGLAAFAAAHLCYLLLFSGISGQSAFVSLRASPLPAFGALVLAASAELWLIPFVGPFKWAVRGYVILITLMFLASLTLPEGHRLTVYGAFAFIVSDVMLAIEMFRLPEGTRVFRYWGELVWALYVLGQSLIFWGVMAG